jgi:transposase
METLNADNTVPAKNGTEKKKRNRKVGGATVIDDKIERNLIKIPVPDEEKICALCGGPKTIFSTVTHERIEFVPAKIILRVEERDKMTCLACHKDVSVAPRTTTPSVVRKVDSSFLAELLTD